MSKVISHEDKKSYLIENALSEECSSIAGFILRGLVFHELHSESGIRIALDKPLGCRQYSSNLERPAVLRQYFGETLPSGCRYSYGNGTGSTTVGTHPNHLVTRDITPDMMFVSEEIYKINMEKSRDTSMLIERPNHCTILFYYHKTPQITNKMLGYHTDNVYSKSGIFLSSKNSQKENTPTCVLTIGDSRNLSFQKQKNTRYNATKRMRWKECKTDFFKLKHNSLFVLHPCDERPHTTRGETFRWRHGVTHFTGKNQLSLALVFRNVHNTINVTDHDDVYDKKYHTCPNISSSIFARVKLSHTRLVSLFLRVYMERYENS